MKRLCVIVFLSLSFFLSTLTAYSQNPFEAGLKEFKDENYEEALAHFQGARKADPSSSAAAYYLGLTYKIMGNYKDAVPPLKDAVSLTPRIKEALVELVDALYQTGDMKEAREYIAMGEKEGVMPGRLQFLKGLVAIKEGKYGEAVTAFEQAKALDSTLSQAAEFQIANAYMRQGKYSDAQKRFRSVNLLDPNSDIATFARDYERLLSEKMEQERPWRVSLGFNYKYDSNVVTKGSGPIVDQISGASGSAVNMAFRLGYTAPFTFKTPYSLSLQYSLFAEKYLDKRYVRADGSAGNLNEFSTMTNVIGAVPGYNFGRSSFTLPMAYAYIGLQGQKGDDFLGDINWYSQARYMEYVSANPTMTFMVNKNHIAELSFGYLQKWYYQTELHPAPIDPAEERDGETFSGSLGWMYFFMQGKGLARMRYSYAQEHTDGRNWSNRENRLSASLLAPIKGKLRGQIAGDVAYTDYTHTNRVFDVKRRNETYTGSVSLMYEIFKDTDVLAQYTYVRDKSNIAIYDYRREIFTVGFEYRY